MLMFLELPKSVNLAFIPLSSKCSISNINILSGLISRCNIPLVCKYDIPFAPSINILILICSLIISCLLIKSLRLPYVANSVTIHILFGINTAP